MSTKLLYITHKIFLGRLDDIILFRRLQEKDLREILKLRLKEAEQRLQRKGLKLVYEETRLLSHLLERALLQPMAMALLEIEAGEDICIELDEDYYRSGMIRSV